MKKNYFFRTGFMLLLAAIFAVQSVAAQSFKLSGTVVDNKNQPLPGVAVLVQGTTQGVATGLKGEYTISVEKGSTLEYSFMGYKTVTVAVANQKTINVTLLEDVASLDEVVVVGYGVQKKSHLTGSVASVSTDGMADVPVANLDQALLGKSAGLQIINTSSEAGSTPSIRVRGMGSISAGSAPLIVVDGFPMEGGLEMVNASDVESIEILKDAASASIYGSRAAGGVILVTTKSGDANKTSYNIKATSGIKRVYTEADMYDTEGYFNKVSAEKVVYDKWALENGKTEKNIDTETAQMLMVDMFGSTNWKELIMNPIVNITTVQGSVSGGTDKYRFYVSGNYTYDQGSMIHSSYQKLNLRAKIDAKLSDNVEFGISLAPQYTKKETPGTGYSTILRTGDWFPAYHTEETIAFIKQSNPNSTGATKKPGDFTQGKDFAKMIFTNDEGRTFEKSMWNTSDNSPMNIMEKVSDFTNSYSLTGNTYLNIKLADGLSFRTSNGFSGKYYNRDYFIKQDGLKPGNAANGWYKNNLFIDLLSENMVTYMKTFGKHDFNILAGYTADLIKIRSAGIEGTFAGDYVSSLNAATELSKDDTKTNTETIAMESFLARLTYSYDDRYLLSASWRADGSSKFGPENRYGYFPSVSLGWRITEEKFMENVSWLDQLKLRLSYGITGNDDIPNYAPYNTLSLLQYPFGDGLATGFAPSSATQGNRALTWEQTNEMNIGLDMSVLGGDLSFTIDAYNSETKSLLLSQSIPSITGYTGYWNNVGKIRNQGIELEINSVNLRRGDFTWNTSFNIATNKNTLLDIGGPDVVYSLGERKEIYMAKVGEPSIQFWSYKKIGVYKDQADCDADTGIESTYRKPGAIKVAHNNDGKLDDKDRYVSGSPFPDFTWGMTNTFTLKDFDMSFTWQGTQGNEMINGDINYSEAKRLVKANSANRWFCQSEEGWGDGMTPNSSAGGINWMLTDHVVENGSYAALRDVTIGYTLPSNIAAKLGVKSLRVYASGQNVLFIWASDFRLVNPEARYTSGQYSNPLVDGYTRANFPLQSTYSLGVDISF